MECYSDLDVIRDLLISDIFDNNCYKKYNKLNLFRFKEKLINLLNL